MLLRRTTWLEAAWIFVTSRLVILFITFIAIIRILPGNQEITHICANYSCLLAWLHYDTGVYINLAMNGYRNFQDTVFFPLWPLLVHYVGITFGASTISYYVASLLLANLFFYLILVVFYCLLRKEGFETTVTRNALFYLAFYPYALFFFTGYTESLFLLLCLATFFCLQHERYWLAGLFGFLAALTRSPGVLLVVPFVVVITQRFWSDREVQVPWQQKLLACFPFVLIPLGVGAFMLYLGISKGQPLAFSTEEAQFWHRYLTFPLTSFITTIQTFSHPATPDLRLLNLLDLVFTLIPLAILASGWRRLPLHYSLFALAMALFSLSYPQGKIEPLTATPRYMMVIFPIIVILATWGKRPHLDRLILACFLPLFAINSVLFINHYWVA